MNDIDTLRSIKYGDSKEFSLPLAVSEQAPGLFECLTITRCLPGKRISCIGRWQGNTIFAKFFIDPKRAKIHWQKEKQGYQLLNTQQVPAPQILHFGIHNGIYFILFEFLKNTTPLKEIWLNSNESQRTQLLTQLTTTLAEHHEKGIIQQDLHLNNFLFSNEQVYTVDGADISLFDPTDRQTASNNIALLFAQFFPANDKKIGLALDHYLALRNWPSSQQLIDQIKTSTLRIREKRKKDRLDKTQRSCSLFEFHHSWDQLTICSRKFQSADMRAFLQSPDSFIAKGESLKRGNTCTVATVTIDNKIRVVKRYNIKNWRHFLSRALRPTRAISSWSNAHLLQFYGISSPEPIAVIERRWGPFRKTAYYLSELSQGEPGGDFFHSEKIPQLDKQTAADSTINLINSLHSLNISHGDLKISNFIIFGLKTSIIDLDSMKQ
ncbi:MAG: lipopolysaccharide kinase InaA family protein, partial [Methylococcaceae bacterium]